MSVRHRLEGRIRVDLPPDEAFVLFTARGEERWVDGWRPRFPVPAPDDTVPGTVFETDHGGETTTWVVIGCEPGRRISYARVTPGSRAGTVTVTLDEDGDGSANVHVAYDLTALNPEAAEVLGGFAAGYPAMMRFWEDAIARSVRA